MGILINTETQERVILKAQQTVGRFAGTNVLIVALEIVSRVHAIIGWNGERWCVQDVSTNGTYVNGSRLPKDRRHLLNPSDSIQFGSLDAEIWHVLDVSAPKNQLVPVIANAPTIEFSNLIALPDESLAKIMLYLDSKGRWVCESDSGTTLIKSGDLISTGDQDWFFYSATEVKSTRPVNVSMFDMNEVKFHFKVSQNEEHVRLLIDTDGENIDLDERNHHYLLLLLARKRMEDRALSVRSDERGWLKKDLLCRMLGINEYYVNILVYRIRKQLMNKIPGNVKIHNAIERRPNELRFIFDAIFIDGGCHSFSASSLVKD